MAIEEKSGNEANAGEQPSIETAGRGDSTGRLIDVVKGWRLKSGLVSSLKSALKSTFKPQSGPGSGPDW